jgi:hypothetical protein
MYSINVLPSQTEGYSVQLYVDTNCSLLLGTPVTEAANQLCVANKEDGYGWFGAFELAAVVPFLYNQSLTTRNPQNPLLAQV